MARAIRVLALVVLALVMSPDARPPRAAPAAGVVDAAAVRRALVDAEGVMQFRDDAYGRDARLAAALERRARPASPREPRVGGGG